MNLPIVYNDSILKKQQMGCDKLTTPTQKFSTSFSWLRWGRSRTVGEHPRILFSALGKLDVGRRFLFHFGFLELSSSECRQET